MFCYAFNFHFPHYSATWMTEKNTVPERRERREGGLRVNDNLDHHHSMLTFHSVFGKPVFQECPLCADSQHRSHMTKKLLFFLEHHAFIPSVGSEGFKSERASRPLDGWIE